MSVGIVTHVFLASVLAQANASAHHIQKGFESCSATAIGPHALLTAAHCLKDPRDFVIDGFPSKIKMGYLDDHDHAILIVDATFGTYAKLGPIPNVGDPIFIFGNPSPFTDLLREGIVSGYSHSDEYHTTGTVYDLNGFFGDSGSGIFNREGEIVGVMGFYLTIHEEDNAQWHATASVPLHFTERQIDIALGKIKP